MKKAKTGKFSIFQAKNVDFVDDFLDTVDEFRQTAGAAWRYEGALSFKPICVSLAFVLPENALEEKKAHWAQELSPLGAAFGRPG